MRVLTTSQAQGLGYCEIKVAGIIITVGGVVK